MMEFYRDNVVYWNILRSIKAAFLQLEKVMITVATLVPMFTIVILGPYTYKNGQRHFMLNVTWR